MYAATLEHPSRPVSPSKPQVIYVKLGVNYIDDLKKRLKKAGISHGALAREMGWSASQLSRSFNRAIDPTMQTVERMERAFLAIEQRRRETTQ